jgi:hypothetical protein
MFLALVAAVSVALAIVMAVLVARQGGVPGLLFLSSVAVMLALLSSALSLLLASILFARHDPARPVRAVWLSLAVVTAAAGYLALL